jgi:hypothetical protein
MTSAGGMAGIHRVLAVAAPMRAAAHAARRLSSATVLASASGAAGFGRWH